MCSRETRQPGPRGEQHHCLEKSVRSRDLCVEQSRGKRTDGNGKFCPAEQENIVSTDRQEAEVGVGCSSEILLSLRDETKEETASLPSQPRTTQRLGHTLSCAPSLSVGVAFVRVTWVTFTTESFSECNFEGLPTGSVTLTLLLNAGLGPLDMI